MGKKIDKKEIDKMIELRKKGLTCEDIAEIMFISEATISKYTHKECGSAKKNELYKAIKKDKENLRIKQIKAVNEELKRQNLIEQREMDKQNASGLEFEKQFYAEWMPGVFR